MQVSTLLFNAPKKNLIPACRNLLGIAQADQGEIGIFSIHNSKTVQISVSFDQKALILQTIMDFVK